MKLIDFWREESVRFDAILFDIDGTLVYGPQPIPGAAEFLALLRRDGTPFFFLTNDASAKWWARGIGLFVNAWISVPSIMLMTTGILTNINHDLYEASSLDGATPFQQFRKITLPFVVFSTTPVLIGQFVGNFNNFGIFFFMRSGVISNYGDYFLASDTDLLINWLYNLSVDNNYYSVGAAISLMIFVITATLSLTVYIRSAAYKQEDTYQ